MKAFVAVLALASVARAQVVAPFAAYSGLPWSYGAGLPLARAGLPLAHNLALPYTTGYAPAVASPVAYAAAAPTYAAAYAPAIALPTPSSQFHQQDEFGNVAHGYSNINSAKHEAGNAYGGVTGSYSYVDANGQLQTTNYIADALGFRVQATNLPVAPVANLAQPEFNLVGPAPVDDTPEVKEAKAAFQAAFDEAASRTKRSTPASTLPLAPYAYAAPFAYGAPYAGAYAAPYAGAFAAPFLGAGYAAPYAGAYAAPYAGAYAAPYAGAYAAPALAAAPVAVAPAAAEGILTKIQNNPGHAISYRID